MQYPVGLKRKLDKAGITFGSYENAVEIIDKRLLSKILSNGFLDKKDPEVIFLKNLYKECLKYTEEGASFLHKLLSA